LIEQAFRLVCDPSPLDGPPKRCRIVGMMYQKPPFKEAFASFIAANRSEKDSAA
jgi:hypothetical protein